MVGVLGLVLEVLVLSSFAMLALFAVAGVVVSAWTVARARRDRRLADELDRVLVGIVGPRSESFAVPARSWTDGHHDAH